MNVTSIEVFPRRHRQTASASALVARYNADGTADETVFHTSALTVAQAVAIQPVGSQSDIVVAGLATGSEFAMLRYLSNGSLDPSFVDTVSPFSGDSFTPERIAVQADGEIVVAGYVASADGTDLGIARYFANGSLDTGFGDGGGVTAGLTVATTDPCGLAIGSDGSIVAACTVQTGTSDYAFGVVRLASDGTLDTSFNQSGEVTDDWGDSCNHATSVAIESDGSILVGGYDASVSGDYVDLVRFLPDGSVDPNFLYGQLAYEPLAGVAYSLAIQPNNMILVGGAFAEAVGERMDFGLARLMDSGAVDQNFGAGGVSAQNLGSGSESAVTAVAVRPDGEILAAGVVGALPTGAPTAAAVDLYFGGEADGAIVRVDDNAPHDLPTSGDATVPANTPYTLTLGDGTTDLGSGSNISYVVNWGDGNLDPPISADDLAAQDDQVTHTYATAATNPITVDLDVAGDLNSPYLVGSESQPVTVDFSDVTTTSLDSITSPVGFGSLVALTATVTPTVSATGTPGGTVEFYDGTIDLGPGTLALNGSYDQATLNTPPLTFGTHSFTAIYGGDGTFDQSTSTPATASVGSSVHGPLTITASEVEGEGAEYALTLPQHDLSSNTIQSWTIFWGDGTFTSINSTTQTQAQMLTQTHTFANGSYTITAVAASSAGNFSASTTLTVDLANAVAQGLTVATSAANYSGYDTLDGGSGAGVEISGSFSDPGALESHTVTIQWGDGSDPVSLQLDPGETTFDYPAPQYARTGAYTISVSVADAAGATSPSTVVVNYSNVAPSALALNLDQSTIYADGQVNLSGSFTDLQANIAHTITIDWGDVSASPRDTTTLWLDAGETTFQADPHTYSAAGNDSISVIVSGIDGSTTATTPVKVNSTTTTLLSSSATPTYGQSVTFTATVLSAVSGNGPPTGTVDFYDETTGAGLGTATLQSNGTAALSISDLAAGGHAITATYSGDNNFPTSQASTSVTITPQTLSIENVSIASTIDKGGIATLTGSVAGLDGAGFILTVGWGEYQGAADSITYPPDTSTFSITHHYVDDASHPFAVAYAVTITVTASDGDGRLPVTDNLTISGDGVAPSVNIAGGPTAIVGNGQSVSVSAVVADPGENCTAFTYQWTATSGTDHHSQIGTSGTFDFVAAFDANYTISLAVTDPDGKTGNASLLIPGDSGGCVTPFQPDVPSVTIEECEADGTPDPSAVPAGSTAYFLVSLADVAEKMPAHGDVKVFYNTQNGNAQGGGCPGGVAQANTDYDRTAGVVTFTYASGYAPQVVPVDTIATSNGGTFSMVAPCVYDSKASIPGGTTSSASSSTTATIEGQDISAYVTDVSFVNALPLYQDPTPSGKTQKPGALITPDWDSSRSGLYPSGNPIPQHPLWFVSYTRATVSATFTLANPVNGVTITVIGTGSDGFCLSAPGTIAGKTVTISNAQATAFSDSILVDPNFTIDWSFKVTKTGDPPLNLPVGTTCNVLYLSYATPIATSAAKYDPAPFNDCACNTVVYLGCKFGGNGGKASALSAAQVVQNLWNNGFAKNALTNAKGDTLSYYQNYITASKTLPGLLATHDGQCIAWAYLLHDVACAQGVSGVNVVSTPVESPKMAPAQLQDFVKFIEPYEQVMVKDWNFAQATIPVPVPIPQTRGPAVWQIVNVAPVRAKIATVLWVWNYETDPWQTGGVHWVRPTPAQQALIATTYPYANLVGPNGYTQAGGTGYNFAPASSDVTDLPGIPGKGTSNPASIFRGHWFCEYYDPNAGATGTSYLFDPSYGGTAPSAAGNWQNPKSNTQTSLGQAVSSSIAGYCLLAKVELADGTKTEALLIRKYA